MSNIVLTQNVYGQNVGGKWLSLLFPRIVHYNLELKPQILRLFALWPDFYGLGACLEFGLSYSQINFGAMISQRQPRAKPKSRQMGPNWLSSVPFLGAVVRAVVQHWPENWALQHNNLKLFRKSLFKLYLERWWLSLIRRDF